VLDLATRRPVAWIHTNGWLVRAIRNGPRVRGES
jgi:hypothetical protein